VREHGYSRYRLDGCRCYVCGWARSEYERNRQKQIAAGTWQPFTEAQPVREHLAALAAAGIGTRRIAELAGISRTAIGNVLHGRRGNPPCTKMRRETAEAILSLNPASTPKASGGIVDGTGTARRVQALCAIGWSLSSQARQAGWLVSNYAGLTAGRPLIARLISDLYDQLSMTPAAGASAARARRFATRHGWVPPLAWDDDEIDDPSAQPAAGTDGRQRSIADFAADYELLCSEGYTRRQIADRLGLHLRALERQIARIGDMAVAS
jgi:transcriptional regulator with XRE-family HTH domain